jgi:hypothetical protein
VAPASRIATPAAPRRSPAASGTSFAKHQPAAAARAAMPIVAVGASVKLKSATRNTQPSAAPARSAA